jgi:hypothetical protein
MGRFMSPDPIAGNVMNPQSWNRYAYVLNNPVRFTDPHGLYCVWYYQNNDVSDYDAEISQSECEQGDGGTWYDNPTTTVTVNGDTGDVNFESTGLNGGFDPFYSVDQSGGGAAGSPANSVTPQQAATTYCQDHGQISFNIPFTKIPVTISASATFGPANYSATNDVSATVPIPFLSFANWLQAGASADITVNAPSQPSNLAVVGLGRNLSVGTFLTPKGPQGASLSLGPSIGMPVSLSVPVGNACGGMNSKVK